MHPVRNLILYARDATDSSLEQTADFLLSPARILFHGKRVAVFPNGDTCFSDQPSGPLTSVPLPLWGKIAQKVIACIIIPLVLLGILLKLVCLKESDYRSFCLEKFDHVKIADPRLVEMFDHVHYTANFTDYAPHSHPAKLVLKPLDLSECACGAYDRLSSNRRDLLENTIVQRLENSHPNKTQPISLLSMGSGELMSDFITLEKLVLAGFTNISIDCVDPTPINPQKVQRVQQFFQNYITLNIRALNDVPPSGTYSAVLAVDYDGIACDISNVKYKATADLIKAYRLSQPNGFMGLGASAVDVVLLSPQPPHAQIINDPSFTFSLSDDFKNLFPQQNDLTIAIPSLTHVGGMNMFLFSLSLALESIGRTYNTITVCRLYRDPTTAQDCQAYRQMLQTLFPSSQVELKDHQNPPATYDFLFTWPGTNEFRRGDHLRKPTSAAYVIDNGLIRYAPNSNPVKVF